MSTSDRETKVQLAKDMGCHAEVLQAEIDGLNDKLASTRRVIESNRDWFEGMAKHYEPGTSAHDLLMIARDRMRVILAETMAE